MTMMTKDFAREFMYKVQPTDIHDELLEEMSAYHRENEKWMKKQNDAAAKRARAHLNRAWHLCRQRRLEIMDERKESKL